TVGSERARLEDDPPGAIPDRQVKPRTARGVPGWQLVARRVSHEDVYREPIAGTLRALDRPRRRVRLEQVDGPVHRRFALPRLGDDAELTTVAIQHAEDEKVSSAEGVSSHSIAWRSKDRRNARPIRRCRHVTGLTAFLITIGAVPPFEEGHLLGKASDR